jgi:hypothetical protein
MTKLQKATDSDTPEKPLEGSGKRAVAATALEESRTENSVKKSNSRALGALSFESTDAGVVGAGFGA